MVRVEAENLLTETAGRGGARDRKKARARILSGELKIKVGGVSQLQAGVSMGVSPD